MIVDGFIITLITLVVSLIIEIIVSWNGVHWLLLKDNIVLLIFASVGFRLAWSKTKFTTETNRMNKQCFFIVCIQTLLFSSVMGFIGGLAIYLALSFSSRAIPDASHFIFVKTAAASVYGAIFSLVAFIYFSLHQDHTGAPGAKDSQ